jgi:hypothetical protein
MKILIFLIAFGVSDNLISQDDKGTFSYKEFSSNSNKKYVETDSSFFSLTVLDISKIDVLEIIIDSVLNSHSQTNESKVNIEKYNFQLVPYITNSGDTKVWVNGLSRNLDFEWEKLIIRPKGAGNKYVTLLINLTKQEVDYYYFNSPY